MNIRASTLVIGESYGIGRCYGYHGDMQFSGIYRVVKRDKTKVVLERTTDGYQRRFSVKTGNELGRAYAKDNFFCTPEFVEQTKEKQHARQMIANAWHEIKVAGETRDVTLLLKAMDALKQHGVGV